MSIVSQPPDTQLAKDHKPKALWRNPGFLILIGGQGISLTGTQITQVTLPLLLLALTNSPAIAGLVTAIGSLSLLLFCLPAGALVDRWDRKKVMIICDSVSTLGLASLAVALLFNQLTLVHIALVAFCNESLGIFFSLANTSALPAVVNRRQIPQALSINETITSSAATVGPALGPVLFSLGRAIPFIADAISTALSVCSLFFIRTQFQQEREAPPGALWHDIWEGMNWLWQHRLIRFLALLTFGLMAPCSGYLLIIDVMAQQMHASNAALSLILASGGLGSIVGALLAGPLYRAFGLTHMIVGSVWVWALSWLLFALAHNPFMLGVANSLGFVIVPIYMVQQLSVRTALTPDHLRGRINAVFRLIAFGSQPIGLAINGLMLQYAGPYATIALLFIPQIILAICVLFQIKFLRQMEKTLAV
ncbi:MFS transporter [Dictyobacter kobayashii]|uniref:MFS transporter n=1 Tax=Dictyobacter kobayashii TaxID=2014872 RepID=A0A402AQ20_9CHLR|nr:MFS transporter [Dictyobacter kobayashii]GCE21271.1 MFS transporter [Dictyobacter kobayashii]